MKRCLMIGLDRDILDIERLVDNLDSLTQGILNCIKNISRDSVFNKEYSGSNLEDVISKA